MKRGTATVFRGALALGAFSTFLLLTLAARGEDWPQWLGPNRNGRTSGFTAPKAWPKELKQVWKKTVGDGVATPALVGDRLYVFTREGGDEVTRCLKADNGDEVWADKYPTKAVTGPDGGFKGPRSSPAVADGMVVTLGVNGTLSCLKAADGMKVWRIETGGVPKFHTSSSPVIVDKLVVAQFGGEGRGGIAAYDLSNGQEKWKWTDEGTAYASPNLLTVGGTKMVVAMTDKSVVGLGLDGKQLWRVPFAVRYNACTPMVDGDTVIYSGTGGGTKAIKVEKEGDKFTTKELWSNSNSVIYNTPIVRDGLLYGLTERNVLYCVSEKDGKGGWEAPLPGGGGGGGKGGKGGKGGFGGGNGYGSILDVGPVLMALTPAGRLVVFEPTDKDFKEVAAYKVAASGTYAYPIVSGNRIYIKDADSLTMYTVE